ncbi:hypothetical protein SASPL_132157 [Salvia splendens]|uniref:O-acyltransferase n=1 Tax=Salvia splendens TaxID=180675 RepID=A0A8X8X773_SALSN|nr:hypothetical protein SASPL_132157 [Salvia splendens]
MAIMDSPEIVGATSSGADNGGAQHATLRRRLSVPPVLGSDSSSPEAESAINDIRGDRNGASLMRNSRGGAAESENRKQDRELSYGNEDEEGREGKVKEGGESSNAKGTDAMAAKFMFRAAAPAHRKNKESPLSSDAIFKQSHAGLFNLCVVVLVAVNSRLIIENLMKVCNSHKGHFLPVLVPYPPLCLLTNSASVAVGAFLYSVLYIVVAVFLHVIITTMAILFSVVVILRCDSAVLSGVALMLFACIVWLKLVSYAHTNYDLRVLAKSQDKWEAVSRYWNLDYSYDVSFKSLVYFMVAPTLCYQPSYPRTSCIRKGWVVRQLIKLVIFTGLMGFIIEQYINPIVQNSQHPLKGNLLYAVERVLKLSVPNLYVWLCMFYCFFHLWLNILAELLCFGDREFYKDWWNAKTVEEVVAEIWNAFCLWKMGWVKEKQPVHKWMVRHIYCPSLHNGLPKMVAILIAFLVSAIFHELCVAVPCHIFKFWAFSGVMLQVPLVIVTNYLQDKFKNSMVGNMMFWCFFCIFGQPMCVLLYYRDLMNRKASTR